MNEANFSQNVEEALRNFNPNNKPLEFQAEAFEVEELEDRIILKAVSRPQEVNSQEETILSSGSCGSITWKLGLPVCEDSGSCTGFCGPTKDRNGVWYCLCA